MDLGKALYYRLSNDNAVKSVLQNKCNKRIQPQESKQMTDYPQIVYTTETDDVDRSFSGRSGVCKDRVKLACMGRTDADAIKLAKAVFASLDDADSRSSPGGTWGGMVVQGCFHKDESASTQSIGETGQESTIYLRELEFDVVYNAS